MTGEGDDNDVGWRPEDGPDLVPVIPTGASLDYARPAKRPQRRVRKPPGPKGVTVAAICLSVAVVATLLIGLMGHGVSATQDPARVAVGAVDHVHQDAQLGLLVHGGILFLGVLGLSATAVLLILRRRVPPTRPGVAVMVLLLAAALPATAFILLAMCASD